MPADITLQSLQPYLSYMGSFIQFGSSALLIVLFLLLRPYARRRRYFVTWSNAWIALCIALFMIMLRYNILPVLPSGRDVHDSELHVRTLYYLYQLSKISFYGLLIAGTLRYVRSAPQFPSIVGFALFSMLYSTLSLLNSADLNGIVVWQSPIAVLGLGYCSYLMLELPRSRRSLGNQLTGSCFAFGALLWLLYLVAFRLGSEPATNPLLGLVRYNTYLDLAWHLALGFGMVVLLLEDVKHEVDAAHAELAVAHDNLRRASFYDPVTGTLNRQAYAEGLGLEAARASFGAVMMLDMDNLKDVNDRFGHAAGDSMLRYLVEVLRSELRASDKLYRFGGDEFLVVFPGADADHITRRLRLVFNESAPLELANGVRLPMRVSAGAAAYTSAEKLNYAIDAADRAMYADKASRKTVPQTA